MKVYLKPYLTLFLSIFIGNFLLQGLVLRQWNDAHLTALRNETINPLILVVNYLIQTAGLVYFMKKLQLFGNPKGAAIFGALWGGLLFINLGLSNYFLVRDYPMAMVISDTLVTIVIFAVAAALTAKTTKA